MTMYWMRSSPCATIESIALRMCRALFSATVMIEIDRKQIPRFAQDDRVVISLS
jgi:hypothetical protein